MINKCSVINVINILTGANKYIEYIKHIMYFTGFAATISPDVKISEAGYGVSHL